MHVLTACESICTVVCAMYCTSLSLCTAHDQVVILVTIKVTIKRHCLKSLERLPDNVKMLTIRKCLFPDIHVVLQESPRTRLV